MSPANGNQVGEVAILGVGMHPWGKWGRNFVEYGVVAAQAALADAGVEWSDIQFVSGADTMRNGYPGYVAGATFAQALGWQGASGRVVVRRVREWRDRAERGAGADPGRAVRRRAGRRSRHHAEGLPRAERGGAGDDPDWLRFRLLGATNPTVLRAVRAGAWRCSARRRTTSRRSR